jgi:hypothetical protein
MGNGSILTGSVGLWIESNNVGRCCLYASPKKWRLADACGSTSINNTRFPARAKANER